MKQESNKMVKDMTLSFLLLLTLAATYSPVVAQVSHPQTYIENKKLIIQKNFGPVFFYPQDPAREKIFQDILIDQRLTEREKEKAIRERQCALDELEKLRAKHPELSSVLSEAKRHFLYGEMELGKQKLADATTINVANVTNGNSSIKQQVDLLVTRARLEFQTMNLSEALRLIDQANKCAFDDVTKADLAILFAEIQYMNWHYELAIEPLRKAICRYKIAYGEGNKKVISAHIRLGEAYYKTKQYKKAKNTLEEATRLITEYTPNEIKLLSDCYIAHGRVEYTYGSLTYAEDYFLKAVEVIQTKLGKNSFLRIDPLLQLTLFYINIKEFKKATITSNSLESNIREANCSKATKVCLLITVAEEYKRLNVTRSAKRLLIEAIELAASPPRQKGAQIGFAYDLLGDCYLTTKNFQIAQDYYQKEKEIFSKVFKKPHAFQVYSLVKLGVIHAEQRNFDKANSFFSEAMSLLLLNPPETLGRINLSLILMSYFYQHYDNPQKFKKFFDKYKKLK